MAKLTLSFKEKRLKIFPVTGSELTVGRAPSCAIQIDSLAVQPQHARIFADNGAYHIEHMQSADPIQVNHKPIAEPTPLRDGDQIQVGKHTLHFSSEPANEGLQANHAPTARAPTGWLQIMSGSHLGRTIRLDRAMTRLGKTGKESAVISRREDGYFIAHLEGNTPPQVNDVSIGDRSHALRDGDRVRIGHLELHFYVDGATDGGSADPAPDGQRRFTRVPFEAAASLQQGDREWTCELIDLSLKGTLIAQPEGWAGTIDETGVLTLRLDNDNRIRMEVRVSHCDGQTVGLACTDIDLDSITHLRRLVELNLGDPALLERELPALGQPFPA